MKTRLFRVTSKRACFGVEVDENGNIIVAAPMGRRYKTLQELIKDQTKRFNAKVEEVNYNRLT